MPGKRLAQSFLIAMGLGFLGAIIKSGVMVGLAVFVAGTWAMAMGWSAYRYPAVFNEAQDFIGGLSDRLSWGWPFGSIAPLRRAAKAAREDWTVQALTLIPAGAVLAGIGVWIALLELMR